MSLPRLTHFYPKIQTVQILSINNTNINEFMIQTNDIHTLTLQGPSIKKIQSTINRLFTFCLIDSLIDDTEFTKFNGSTVHILYLSNCTNLKALNTTFINLHSI